MEQSTEPCTQVGIHGHHGQTFVHWTLILGMIFLFSVIITLEFNITGKITFFGLTQEVTMVIESIVVYSTIVGHQLY